MKTAVLTRLALPVSALLLSTTGLASQVTWLKSIAAHMSTQQLIGQIALVDVSMLTKQASGNNGDGKTPIDYALLHHYRIGNVYVGGNDRPLAEGKYLLNNAIASPRSFDTATMGNWQMLADKAFTAATQQFQFKQDNQTWYVTIAPLLGTDAVHGNQHVLSAITFPQNIGMSATHNPALFTQEGKYTALSVLRSGFNWVFAPTIGPSLNPKWGRFYETSGTNPQFAALTTQAFVRGAQMPAAHDAIDGVLTTIKHFIGYSSVWNGVDESNVVVKPGGMANFLQSNEAVFMAGIAAGAGAIMPAYSAINGVRMSLPGKLDLLTALRKQTDFNGFYVSDQQAVNKANTLCVPLVKADGKLQCKKPQNQNYTAALAQSIKRGMNMVMTIGDFTPYRTIAGFEQEANIALEKRELTRADLVRAVLPILATKVRMGLLRWSNKKPVTINMPSASDDLPRAFAAALKSAEQSLVLLKNKNRILPLKKSIKNIILIGNKSVYLANGKTYKVFSSFNNLGAENGGWTASWQGFNGNVLERNASKYSWTLLQALQKKPKIHLYYLHFQGGTLAVPQVEKLQQKWLTELKRLIRRRKLTPQNTVIIGVLAENPYAEFMGDVASPFCRSSEPMSTAGCLYHLQNVTQGQMSPYATPAQPHSLKIDYGVLDQQVLKTLAKFKLITVLFSGRPMLLEPVTRSAAIIAAWLPGDTGGLALTRALFGRYRFKSFRLRWQGRYIYSNTSPVPWPRTMQALVNFPVYTKQDKGLPRYANPRYRAGFGLRD